MTTTPNLALAYIVASQAQKEVTHNSALNDLDALAQLTVIDTTISTPPASPNTGDTYIIGASPTGAWGGFASSVAAYYGGWIIKTPQIGWLAWTRNGNHLLYWNGSAWSTLAAPVYDATFTWTPGTIANASTVSSPAVSISAAAFGDLVLASAPYDVQGLVLSTAVNSAGSVKVTLVNLTGASISLTSGTWRVRVLKV